MTAAVLEELTAQELIEWAVQKHGDRFALVTSFQLEGMVLLDMAVRIHPGVRVITIDTGRLPAETFDMIERVRERYGVTIEIVCPDAAEAGRMTTLYGPNLFLESVAHRRACCEIRKIRPMQRKMAELDAYAVGLRRGQTESRALTPKVLDENGKCKLSPLADWSRQEVEAYTRRHDVPVHPLYARGYTSIGCASCTRAPRPGEDERAGRWWWETGEASECGLHFTPDGKAQRSIDVLLREILSD